LPARSARLSRRSRSGTRRHVKANIRRDLGVFGGTRRLPSRKAATRSHCSLQEGHILNSERQQLGNAQAKAGVCDHHCLTPRWHCLSQGLQRATDSGTIRSRSERGMLGRATGLDVKSRSWTAAEKMDRTRSRSVPGERTWDRSLTQACTCEVRTIASRRTDLGAVKVLVDQRSDSRSRGRPVGTRRCPLACVLTHCDRVCVADLRA
jgi:hypothetical protein